MFVVLMAVSTWNIYYVRGALPTSISLFDALLILLAIFRLTRLVVYDKILRFLRELFVHKQVVHTEQGEMVKLTPYQRGIRRTISELLACPWCTGVWFALPIVYGYFMYSWSWYLIFMFAVAGLATLVQLIANLIGWQAELGKLAAKVQNEKCG